MNFNKHLQIKILILLLALPLLLNARVPANGKLKVFILSGQSNMTGRGMLGPAFFNPEGLGTMWHYLQVNEEAYGHLVDRDGNYIVRDDVWIVYGLENRGWLTKGYSLDTSMVGPEYAFGFVMGDYFEDPVLLIKASWGATSLSTNFLSPSSADYSVPQADGDTGWQYMELMRQIEEVTGNLETYFPDYSGDGYEIMGFGWHQGISDRSEATYLSYESNMVNFIKDMREDVGVPDLPFVIANTGHGGWDIVGSWKDRVENMMEQQLAMADWEKYPEFHGNTAAVETRGFQRTREESPNGQDWHWYSNWETFYLIGKELADSMITILPVGPVNIEERPTKDEKFESGFTVVKQNGSVFLKTASDEEHTISIFDLSGRRILSWQGRGIQNYLVGPGKLQSQLHVVVARIGAREFSKIFY